MNALKWPLSCEEEEQKWSPNEVRSKQFPQNLPKTPTTMSSLGSSSYSVLPPIGKPMTGKEPESSLGQCVNTAGPIHKSSSDGYLVQMEKQKQLRARVTYKVGMSVSFICVVKGGILNVHTFFICCRYICFISVLLQTKYIKVYFDTRFKLHIVSNKTTKYNNQAVYQNKLQYFCIL